MFGSIKLIIFKISKFKYYKQYDKYYVCIFQYPTK